MSQDHVRDFRCDGMISGCLVDEDTNVSTIQFLCNRRNLRCKCRRLVTGKYDVADAMILLKGARRYGRQRSQRAISAKMREEEPGKRSKKNRDERRCCYHDNCPVPP